MAPWQQACQEPAAALLGGFGAPSSLQISSGVLQTASATLSSCADPAECRGYKQAHRGDLAVFRTPSNRAVDICAWNRASARDESQCSQLTVAASSQSRCPPNGRDRFSKLKWRRRQCFGGDQWCVHTSSLRQVAVLFNTHMGPRDIESTTLISVSSWGAAGWCGRISSYGSSRHEAADGRSTW